MKTQRNPGIFLRGPSLPSPSEAVENELPDASRCGRRQPFERCVWSPSPRWEEARIFSPFGSSSLGTPASGGDRRPPRCYSWIECRNEPTRYLCPVTLRGMSKSIQELGMACLWFGRRRSTATIHSLHRTGLTYKRIGEYYPHLSRTEIARANRLSWPREVPDRCAIPATVNCLEGWAGMLEQRMRKERKARRFPSHSSRGAGILDL